MSSEDENVKLAGKHLQQMLITSGLVVLEEETPQTTSSLFADLTTQRSTLWDLKDSLNDMDEESTDEEKSKDSLLFSATLNQISKIEEGGFLLAFEVPENEREEVSRLIALGARVFSLVCLKA